ncbi:MAG: hypothetical protein CVU41_07735 [Chloroflexi bacterium HGW-Chloroflexi-3]|nr:MAG: hypothetical protein CVU41_07735 [Chloroflexi bacterium HGW-Chloroflexi-3]
MKFSKQFMVTIFVVLLFSGCTSAQSSVPLEVPTDTSQSTQVEPSPTALITEPSTAKITLTWETGIREIFEQQCSECHSSTPSGGFSITSYTKILQGSNLGPVIIPGNPEESHLFYKLTFGGNHPGYLSKDQTDMVWEWVSSGALEYE